MTTIDGYAVGGQIARGGFAQVYFGQQQSSGRPVALKVLDRIGEKEERRFGREFESLRRLSHNPNIVDVLELTRTDDGAPCIVLEHMPGGSLDDLLEANPGGLAEADVAFIADRLLGALAEAHGNGVVHRDLKPSNVLLGNGNVKLSDFGIAKFTESSGTTSAAISTTVLYAAPEVLMDRGATERSDLYSLGSTVVTVLTGRPLHGSVSSALASAATGKAPELDLPNASPGLVAWLQRLVAHDPVDRFPTADDARRALAGLVPSQPGPQLERAMGAVARPASFEGPTRTVTVAPKPETSTIVYQPRTQGATRRSPFRALVAAVLVIGALAGGGWILLNRPIDFDEFTDAGDGGDDPAPPTTNPPPDDGPTTTEEPDDESPISEESEDDDTPETEPPDDDNDGVINDDDQCRNTPAGYGVDSVGCALDDDGDGVANDLPDQCPSTPAGYGVDSDGCALDGDGDGVPDDHPDRCPSTPQGESPDEDGCAVSERDGDQDGYTPSAGDCDDGDPDVNPGATEIVGNGKDDDCNGGTPSACPVVQVPVNAIPIQVWTLNVNNGDRQFGGNPVQVSAQVETWWDDANRLRLQVAYLLRENGGDTSIGHGNSNWIEVARVGDGERIVDVTVDGTSQPRNGVAAKLDFAQEDRGGAHTARGSGLVSTWRYVVHTSGDDIGRSNGDDDANITASFRLIQLHVERQTAGCGPE